ncbi:MAG TPA: cold shock domain-containing protein [Bacteroidales bacterium]|nr:cold shock domain-containing protein [Bacteroidales bacterium]
MGRSQETQNKKEVKNRQEKKRKEKQKKSELRKAKGEKSTFNDMIAYVDEFGRLSSVPPDSKNKISVSAEDIEISPTRNKPLEKPDFQKGRVVSFNTSRGFGFIMDLDTKQSFFVHANNIEEAIKENDLVVFEAGRGAKGPVALKVKLFREKE